MEANNMKAMREAVQFCVKQMTDAIFDKDFGDDALYLVGCMKVCIDRMKSALADPVRNCDVGTAEEQNERFEAFCQLSDSRDCGDCPFWTSGRIGRNCELKWAQMPYEEGGAK